MKTHENIEIILETKKNENGSRTWTRQRLARGLGPDSDWLEDLDPNTGVVLRGNTTGKHNGETKREQTGK